MKYYDARIVLDYKKQHQNLRYVIAPERKITDAREVLDRKRKFKIYSSNSNSISKKKFKKTFETINHGKHVEFSNGNLIVTSQNFQNSRRILPKEPRQGAMSITIVKKKSQINQKPDNEIDDLENMTVNDLPEFKLNPPGVMAIQMQPKESLFLQKRSMADELLNMKNTMVADYFEKSDNERRNFKVLVTNLLPSVSRQDIIELFAHVGDIKSAELKSGVALVEYFNIEDAMRACDLYHNRLLDGQPMQCVLKHSNISMPKTSISQRLGNRVETVDLSRWNQNSSRALLNYINPSNRSSNSNVKFTVKLPSDTIYR